MYQISLNNIVSFIQNELIRIVNQKEKMIIGPSTLEFAQEGNITFCKNLENAQDSLLSSCKASLIVCNESIVAEFTEFHPNVTYLFVKEPRKVFIKILNEFFLPETPKSSIDPTAVIHKDAKISNTTFIGAHCYIGNSSIGNNCVIHPGVKIYDQVKIGDNVIIHAGTIIGSDGFGYERNSDGILEKFYHYGGVTIGNNVEIGANTCIDRGTLGNTVIEQGVKIDNLVHIAHNVFIAENTVVIANSMIAGSVKIAKNCWVAPSSSILNGVSIGEGAFVGIGAVALKNVETLDVVAGVPAKSLKKRNE